MLRGTLQVLNDLDTIAGTNTITAVANPVISSYTQDATFMLIPANDNTGATTLNIDTVGAGAVKLGGAALAGGELQAGVPVILQVTATTPVFEIVGYHGGVFPDSLLVKEQTAAAADQAGYGQWWVRNDVPSTPMFSADDGTETILGTHLGTEVDATNGGSDDLASIDFTGIPSGIKKITIIFVGISTTGTSQIRFQLGDAGGIENASYLGSSFEIDTAPTGTGDTDGLGLEAAVNTAVLHGTATWELENATGFTWVGTGVFASSADGKVYLSASSKSLSAELTQVRITTTGGSDTFDAGVINIQFS